MSSISANWFKDVLRIEKGDRLPTLLMFVWFLLAICAYYVIRPVRSTLVLFSLGPEFLPWVYMGTAFATGVAVWIFSKFSRAPRRWLIGGTMVFLVLNLLFWWWAAGKAVDARAAGNSSWNWTSPVFYVWADVFSSMAVTVFWMFAADFFGHGSAKRTFGILAAAGPAGGFAGAWLSETLAGPLGPVTLVLVAAAVFTLAFLFFVAVEIAAHGRSAHAPAPRPEGVRDSGTEAASAATKPAGYPEDRSGTSGGAGPDFRKARDVARALTSSRMLLFLTLVVCFERVTPDFVDWVFQSAGHAAISDPTRWTEFFAAFDKWRELLVLVATLFVTSPLLVLGGPTWALASVPVAIVLFGLGFAVWPLFFFAVALKGTEEGQRHAWFKAGKELVYTVTNRDVIYSVKGYIEVFLYRFSRGVAGLLLLLLTAVVGLGPQGVALATVPLAAVWLWCIHRLGREYKAAEEREERQGVS
jgi:AAA family ATP:ADP antiporter